MSKSKFVLESNIVDFVSKIGNRAVFVTVTFPDAPDSKEARRRWNSFSTNFLKGIFSSWILVVEYHKSGVPHYHMVADAGFDALHGFKGFSKRGGKTVSLGANAKLRALWRILRERAPSYGIGRIQTEPVRKPAASGAYLAKYLSKGQRSYKGERLVSYSRLDRLCNFNFSFLNGPRRAMVLLRMWDKHRGFFVSDGSFLFKDYVRAKSFLRQIKGLKISDVFFDFLHHFRLTNISAFSNMQIIRGKNGFELTDEKCDFLEHHRSALKAKIDRYFLVSDKESCVDLSIKTGRKVYRHVENSKLFVGI